MNQPLAVMLGHEPVDPALLGGKGGALAALVKADLPVPRCAVITTAAYERAVREPCLASLITALAEGRCDATDAEIDEHFLRAGVPAEVTEAVMAVYRSVSAKGSVELAVRSSATAEDLGSASFAGQYRSFLGVADAEALLQVIPLVWASLWHRAPRSYRHFHRVPHGSEMAVVMMAMVDARRAGVAFTIDPGGAVDRIRVEQVEGLAEGLVSGRLTPTVHLLDRTSPGQPETPPPLGEVGALAMRCEELFGRPQDIEWAWDGTAVWLVQSRPITTITHPDDDDGAALAIGPMTRCTTAGIGEMMPGVLPVLRWSTLSFLVEEAFRRAADDLRALPSDIVGREGFVVRVRGRAAMNLDAVAAVAAKTPGGSAAALEQQYFGTASEPATAQPTAQPSKRKPLDAIGDLRVMAANHAAQREAAIVDQAVRFVVDAPVELTAHGEPELLALRSRLIDLAARTMAAELTVAAAAAAAYERLEMTLQRHLGERANHWTQRLTRSSGEVTIPAQAARLGRQMQQVCPAALTDQTWELARRRLDDLGRDDLIGAVLGLARRAGCRAVFGGPTWDEDSQSLWELIRAGATREAGGDTHAGDSGDLEQVEHELTARPGWRRTRVLTGQIVDVRIHLVRRLTADARALLRQREESKVAVLSLGAMVRRVEQALGRRLAERDVLEDAADIEHLTPAELSAAVGAATIGGQVEGQGPAPDTVAARRRCVERWATEDDLPLRFVGPPGPQTAPVPSGDRLSGWGASPGRHTGRVRLLSEPDTSGVQRGDVVVARRTDASWSPVFLIAGAIVVEEGGPLSHAAIVARELGLPAVLNVPGIVARLRADHVEQITVDGDLGVVVIASSALTPADTADTARADVVRPVALIGPPTAGTTATEATFDEFDEPRVGIFVPAIMSVGVVFSVTAVLRDLVERTATVTSGRSAEVRGRLSADLALGNIVGGGTGGAEYLRNRGTLAATALIAAAFATYVGVGATANYFRQSGYLSSIAWLWALNLLIVAVTAAASIAALAAAARPAPPNWAWPILLRTPLVVTKAHTDRQDLARWAATGAAAATTVLTIMVAGRGPLRRFDQTLAGWTDAAWVDNGAVVLRWVGATSVSLITAVTIVTVITAVGRCPRVPRLMFAAIGTALVITTILRVLLDRSRPASGAWAGQGRSFPSGHVVQATLLTMLVPLAVFALTRRQWASRLATVVLALLLGAMAVHRVATGEHWPTDVIGGLLLGAAIGLWARASLLDPTTHRRCHGCAFRTKESR